jgi:hypothetical protein
MLMAGDVKPAKVSVYEKLTSVTDPDRMTGVQFGFGQPTGAPLKLTDFAGTDNCPFFAEVTVASLVGEKLVVWDSTALFGFVPWLKQSMIAVYLAVKTRSASVCPTPPCTRLHPTRRASCQGHSPG